MRRVGKFLRWRESLFRTSFYAPHTTTASARHAIAQNKSLQLPDTPNRHRTGSRKSQPRAHCCNERAHQVALHPLHPCILASCSSASCRKVDATTRCCSRLSACIFGNLPFSPSSHSAHCHCVALAGRDVSLVALPAQPSPPTVSTVDVQLGGKAERVPLSSAALRKCVRFADYARKNCKRTRSRVLLTASRPIATSLVDMCDNDNDSAFPHILTHDAIHNQHLASHTRSTTRPSIAQEDRRRRVQPWC